VTVPRSRRRLVLRWAVAALIVAAVFVGVLPQLADLTEAWEALRALPGAALLQLSLLTVGVLLATWVALARLIEGSTLGQAALAHLLSTAVANTVPAGGAVAVGVNLRVHGSYGRSVATTTTGLLTMGVLDNAVKLGLPLVLVGLGPLVPGAEQLPAPAAAGALAVLAVTIALAVGLGREPVVARVATWAQGLAARRGRGGDARAGGGDARAGGGDARAGGGEVDWAEGAVRYLRGLRATLRHHGPSAFVAVAVSHLLQIALLVLALRAVGVPDAHAGVVRVTVVYVLVRLVTALPVTPGGLGVAELGLVAGLQVGAPAELDGPILAAAMLFRAATYLLPVLLAPLTWAWWRWDRPAVPPDDGAADTGASTPRGGPV
jgi:putative heme transporter